MAGALAFVGFVLLVTAKVVGTAVLARLFQLTQTTLMQFGWFAHWYPRWKAWKDALLLQVRESEPWRMGQRAKARLKARVKAWWATLP